MNASIRKFLLVLATVGLTAASACSGCEDETGSTGLSADGVACTSDDDCLGTCGDTDLCEGGNNAANNTTGTDNNATNGGANNTTGGTGNNTTGSTTGGTNNATTGATNNATTGATNNATTGTNGGTNGSTDGAFETNGSGQVLCGTDPCACDNGIDDDGDGLIDGLDPECTGPYDNDEGTFATGIPGDNKDPKWQDCFFDGNSGAGDDKCRYATGCLTGELPPTDEDCQLSQACIDFCAPRTPNGCDCFGCCEVATSTGSTFVVVGGTCSTADLGACASCQQTDACANTCGRCELCLGKTRADLPEDCAEGGGFTGETCNVDSDCQGICGGSSTCEGFGSGGGFDGSGCASELDCRGVCGGANTCEGYGSGNGFDGQPCLTTSDCRGICGGDGLCSGSGAGGGYDGSACLGDNDCRGICGASNTCEGYASGGGYDGDTCQGDNDCRGTCGADNTCTGSGSGSGSGVQCENGTACNASSDCDFSEYCQTGCCIEVIL